MSADTRQWIVDSIENDSAVIEQSDGKIYNVPLAILPKGIREGQICRAETEERTGTSTLTTITIDEDATRAALKKSAAQLAATPASKDPGGNITL